MSLSKEQTEEEEKINLKKTQTTCIYFISPECKLKWIFDVTCTDVVVDISHGKRQARSD